MVLVVLAAVRSMLLFPGSQMSCRKVLGFSHLAGMAVLREDVVVNDKARQDINADAYSKQGSKTPLLPSPIIGDTDVDDW